MTGLILKDIINLIVGLKRVDENIHRCIAEELSFQAAPVEAKIKREAPWTDRTGFARKTLGCMSEYEKSSKKYYFLVFGSMSYSPELELGHGKNYAILYPTIEEISPKLLKNVAERIDGQGGVAIE